MRQPPPDAVLSARDFHDQVALEDLGKDCWLVRVRRFLACKKMQKPTCCDNTACERLNQQCRARIACTTTRQEGNGEVALLRICWTAAVPLQSEHVPTKITPLLGLMTGFSWMIHMTMPAVYVYSRPHISRYAPGSSGGSADTCSTKWTSRQHRIHTQALLCVALPLVLWGADATAMMDV